MPLNTIINVIAETMRLDPESIDAETRLETLGIDSLKAINILFELEEIYEVEVPNEVITQLETVRDIENTLTELLDKK